MGHIIWLYTMIPLIIRIYLKAFKRGIEYGPYNMNYFIYTILNRPYHMVHIKWVVHMIWLILNAPYKMKYTYINISYAH